MRMPSAMVAIAALSLVAVVPLEAQSIASSDDGRETSVTLFDKAKKELASEHFQRAIDLFKKALRLGPSAEAFFGLGHAYYRLGDSLAGSDVEMLERAREAFQNSVDLAPDPEGYYHIGVISLALRDKAGAEKALQSLKKLDRTKATLLSQRIARYRSRPFKTYANSDFNKEQEKRDTALRASGHRNAQPPATNKAANQNKLERCKKEADEQVHYPVGTTRMSSAEESSADADYNSRKASFINRCMGN